MSSKFDRLYRRFLLSKFFVKGWGNPDHLERIFDFRKLMSNKELCYKMVDPNHPVTITKESSSRKYKVLEGFFHSPLASHLPGIIPPSAVKAHFRALLPHTWPNTSYKPVCIHLAGTGDHNFNRRHFLMGGPLLKEHGIGSIILENPFYGSRKPPQQQRSSLEHVSDLFVMGGCLILECMVLMHWCAKMNLGPVGITGISMGGHMASLAAVSWPKPVPLIPCLSWTSASAVFTEGVLSQAIDWQLLKEQYLQNEAFREVIFNKVYSPEGHFSVYKEADEFFTENRSNSRISEKISDKVPLPDHSALSSRQKIFLPPSYDVKEIQQSATSQSTSRNGQTLDQLLSPGSGRLTFDKKNVNHKYSENFPPQFSHIDQERNVLASLHPDSPKIRMGKTAANNAKKGKKKKLDLLLNPSERKTLSSNVLSSSQVIGYPKLFFLGSGITSLPGNGKFLKKLWRPFLPHRNIDESEKERTSLSNPDENLDNPDENLGNPGENLGSPAPLLTNCDPHMSFTPSGVRPQGTTQTKPVAFRPNYPVKDAVMWEVFQFMRAILDECTHLGNFGHPTDPSLIIVIQATYDAYMPVGTVLNLDQVWPGCQIRHINCGHINGFLRNQPLFRTAIKDAFEMTFQKYGSTLDS